MTLSQIAIIIGLFFINLILLRYIASGIRSSLRSLFANDIPSFHESQSKLSPEQRELLVSHTSRIAKPKHSPSYYFKLACTYFSLYCLSVGAIVATIVFTAIKVYPIYLKALSQSGFDWVSFLTNADTLRESLVLIGLLFALQTVFFFLFIRSNNKRLDAILLGDTSNLY